MNEQTLPQNEYYTPETDLQTPQVSQEITAENPFPNVQQFNPSGENVTQTEATDTVPNFPEATPPAMPAENVVTLQTENDLAQEIMGSEPKIETAPKPEVSMDSSFTAQEVEPLPVEPEASQESEEPDTILSEIDETFEEINGKIENYLKANQEKISSLELSIKEDEEDIKNKKNEIIDLKKMRDRVSAYRERAKLDQGAEKLAA